MDEIISGIEKNASLNMSRKETYSGPDGYLYCKKCRKPVQAFVSVLGRIVPVKCECDEVAEKEREKQAERERVERMVTSSPLYDASYDSFTFERDKYPNSEASRLCRAYVDHWPEMERNNFGILFTGTLGTGKSYYAAAIVNALRNKGISAIIVTTSRLINTIRSGDNPQSIIDGLNRFRLVVLDDLGAERDTEYSIEQLENFINCRSLCKRPLIVTTNRTRKAMDNPTDMSYARIYDRIKVMCCRPVILTGESRRAEQERERSTRCKEILGI